MAFKALIIDDDAATLDFMKFRLTDEGFDVTTADRGGTALNLVGEIDFDIILTDLNLPDLNGIEMVKRAKQLSPETEIIMITGFGSTEKAIEATKAGAFHYVEKPVVFEELILLIGKAVERKQQAREIRELRGRLTSRTSYEGIIGASRAMQAVYEMIDSVAESDANILILGESGTGKEIIANAIHYKSLRSKKAFVKVNCSALPKDLIESQLFGHTKGSFTGATSDRNGFIGQANGGSLLLDEIAEMPLDLQPKLLRVLQERVYYRVGSDTPQAVDFRLICATNRDPFDAMQVGSLREDLYYRINTIEIKIPPLRDRMEDVPMLAEHFLTVYAEKYRGKPVRFSQQAFNQMLSYNWRGNVRELQNTIERAVLLTKSSTIYDLNIPRTSVAPIEMPKVAEFEQSSAGKVGTTANVTGADDAQIPFAPLNVGEDVAGERFFEEVGRVIVSNLSDPLPDAELQDVFDKLEAGVVLAALKRTAGNKQAAALLLGLYRPRLYGMIKRHKLEAKI